MTNNLWDNVSFQATDILKENDFFQTYSGENHELASLTLSRFKVDLFATGDFILKNLTSGETFDSSLVKKDVALRIIAERLYNREPLNVNHQWYLENKQTITMRIQIPDEKVNALLETEFDLVKGEVWSKWAMFQFLSQSIKEMLDFEELTLSEKEQAWLLQIEKLEIHSRFKKIERFESERSIWSNIDENKELNRSLLHIEGEISNQYLTFIWEPGEKMSEDAKQEFLTILS